MTIIISAFPCLGKTTLTNQNKEKYYDAEIYESRATKGMSNSEQKEFFKASALKIKLIYNTGYYDAIFVTDDERLLEELRLWGLPIIHVLPNPNNKEHLQEYISRVIARSGLDWYQRVLSEDILKLEVKLQELQSRNETVYLVEPNKYIEHLVPELAKEECFSGNS
jgi:hypothetical protein